MTPLVVTILIFVFIVFVLPTIIGIGWFLALANKIRKEW